MKIKRFYGKDMREALKQVKDELGGDAVIMSNKKYADGIEIIAAYDKEPSARLSPKKEEPKVQTYLSKKIPTLSEIIGDTGPDSLKALLEKQTQGTSQLKTKDVQPVYKHQSQAYSGDPIAAIPGIWVNYTRKEPQTSAAWIFIAKVTANGDFR
jgi:flagellar biosynthesis protein FlhF